MRSDARQLNGSKLGRGSLSPETLRGVPGRIGAARADNH